MKIVQSIEKLYSSKHDFYEVLEKKVVPTIDSKRKSNWHFTYRLKSLESFALKLETGRFNEESIFYDFFACALVVENLDEIENAEDLIEQLFEMSFKIPQSNRFTLKSTDSFVFDDLRIYCKLGSKYLGAISPEVQDLIFEVQIKTFLQHAWSIATHDLIYKTDTIAWGKERIAYQVKAALEQAEVAISGVSDLSKVHELAKENKLIKKTNRIIRLLNKHFKTHDLPVDRRRLSQNIISLIEQIGLSVNDLDGIISRETTAGRGAHIKNISPFQIIIQSICSQNQDLLAKFLRQTKETKYKLLVTSETDLSCISQIKRKNIIRIK